LYKEAALAVEIDPRTPKTDMALALGEAAKTVADLRGAGIRNINFDLIYSLPQAVLL